LLARDMDALVVRAQGELGDEVVRAPDEGLALELADHVVRHLVGDLLEPALEVGPALGAAGRVVAVPLAGQQAVPLLDGDAALGELGYAGLEEGRREDEALDV